jgi:hypothetical protein
VLFIICNVAGFSDNLSSSEVEFLICLLEARRSMEYLKYVRETKMLPPLLSAIRLHSLVAERKRSPIMYNDFFIQQSLGDLILIYETLGARGMVRKLKTELKRYNEKLLQDIAFKKSLKRSADQYKNRFKKL